MSDSICPVCGLNTFGGGGGSFVTIGGKWHHSECAAKRESRACEICEAPVLVGVECRVALCVRVRATRADLARLQGSVDGLIASLGDEK